jgi:tRNA (cmo5U34)-methyltransferase
MKDSLFSTPQEVKPFAFNQAVADVFDDMVSRSIPIYDSLLKELKRIIQLSPRDQHQILDLGTSTGSLLFYLQEHLPDRFSKMMGVDSSEPMIAKAKAKANQRASDHIVFEVGDITKIQYPPSDIIVLNYVLQFLSPESRVDVLKNCRQSLSAHGFLIVAEKIISNHPDQNKAMIACYDHFKLEKNYSHLEISQKRKALENVLVPWTLQENQQAILDAGFSSSEPILLWNNFVALRALP